MTNHFEIKSASPDDVPLILTFIKELAVYEKLSHQVFATEEKLYKALFGERTYAEVIIGSWDLHRRLICQRRSAW